MSLFGNFNTENKDDIKFIEPNYEGIAKVLAQFVELYKVCDNKELLDKNLAWFLSRPLGIIKNNIK